MAEMTTENYDIEKINSLMQGGISIIPNFRIKGMVNIAIHHKGDFYCVDFTRDELKQMVIDLERIANDMSW